MSKNVAVFIDVANLYYSARGQDVDVDYVALLKYATKGRDLIRAYAYSGLDPENENQRKFLDFLSKNGYKVVHKDIRKFGDGRVKANLDIELVVDLFRLAPRMDVAVIVSGDGDFASAIRALQDIGVRCEVISFRPNTSSDLLAVADEFTDIMKILGIGRKKGEKGLSMPEMPAKEVNPEFGFREASRGVAAAALAALREGEKPPTRTRRGRTTPSQVPVEALTALAAATIGEQDGEPVEPMTAVEAHVDGSAEGEPGRRRRRRRGGRGRGRGRRVEGQAETAPPATDEIGWQEFDDISQVGLTDLGEPGEEREYSFEEADPQTLAELGLAAGSQAASVPESSTTEASSATGTKRAARGASRGTGRGTGRGRTTRGSSIPAGEPPPAVEPRANAPNEAEGAQSNAPSQRATSRRRKPAGETPGAEPRKAPLARSRSRRSNTGAAQPPAAQGGGTGAARPTARGRTSRAAGATSAGGSSEASATQPPSDESPSDEGIWQRFRSGRRTTRSSS